RWTWTHHSVLRTPRSGSSPRWPDPHAPRAIAPSTTPAHRGGRRHRHTIASCRRLSVSHDHVGVMLDALLAVPVPDGYTSVRRDRYDAVLDHTFRDVTISPPGVDVSTFGFGTPGAYAYISVDDGDDTYIVGVFAT